MHGTLMQMFEYGKKAQYFMDEFIHLPCCPNYRYPETWQVNGKDVFYRPNMGAIPQGQYRSGDPVVVKEHVKALDYAHTDLSIVSCKYKITTKSSLKVLAFADTVLQLYFFSTLFPGWGPSDRLDRARRRSGRWRR